MITIAVEDINLSKAIERVASRYDETNTVFSITDLKRSQSQTVFVSERLKDGNLHEVLEDLVSRCNVYLVGTRELTAGEAIRYTNLGVTVLPAPVLPEHIINVALNKPEPKQPKRKVKEPVNEPHKRESFVRGVSDRAIKLYNELSIVAPHNITVILHGETGTGKEHLAEELHFLSKRPGRFVTIDCGAVSKELALSELFGHVKGSFTGAHIDREGAFQAADQGTLFLDEVENLSLEVQMHLLRAIQERKIRKVGTSVEKEVDVRIVVATNVNLEYMVEQGLFRRDLYYRLSQFVIEVPPLRDRKEDIPLLIKHFVLKYEKEFGKDVVITNEFINELVSKEWKGNIRELQSAIQRSVLFCEEKLKVYEPRNILDQATSYKVSKIEIARSLGSSLYKLHELINSMRD